MSVSGNTVKQIVLQPLLHGRQRQRALKEKQKRWSYRKEKYQEREIFCDNGKNFKEFNSSNDW